MRLTWAHVAVDPHEAVVRYLGADAEILTTGRHPRRRSAIYRAVDLRRQLLQLATQEIPTADGALVKATAVIELAVSDPIATLAVANPQDVVYLAVQIALRDEFATLSTEDAAKAPRLDAGLTERLTSRAIDAGASVGVRVFAVVLKDVILPPDLRTAALELITARTRGLAQLEAARSETAALRSLANGAKILEDHPALAQLRMVQSLPLGSTLQLTLPSEDSDR